jgi:hypothetical protein
MTDDLDIRKIGDEYYLLTDLQDMINLFVNQLDKINRYDNKDYKRLMSFLLRERKRLEEKINALHVG